MLCSSSLGFVGPRNKSRKRAVVSLAVNSDRPQAVWDPSQGSVCLRAAALAITRLADIHYIPRLPARCPKPPSAALQSRQLCPALLFCAVTFPTPSRLCPLSQLPGGMVAGWHWSHPPGLASQHISVPSLAACQATERVPPAPEASLHHLRGPEAAWARHRAWLHSQECPSQRWRREAPSKLREQPSRQVWGILPPMPTRRGACGAKQGRGGSTLLAHPLPLPIGVSPPVCTVHGKAGCDMWIVFPPLAKVALWY